MFRELSLLTRVILQKLRYSHTHTHTHTQKDIIKQRRARTQTRTHTHTESVTCDTVIGNKITVRIRCSDRISGVTS